MKYLVGIVIICTLVFAIGASLNNAVHESDITELNEASYCGDATVVDIDRPKGTTKDLVYCSDHAVKWR